MWKTLYKKDSKDKIRIWRIRTDDSTIIQQSGILDGKLAENKKEAKAKNIGKINETTPVEQAKLELESEYKSKLDEGYVEDINNINNPVILPMLAKDFNKYKNKIDWNNCYIQPKLDGQRCLAFVKKDGSVKLISRDNKEIKNMDHIIKQLSNIKKDIILDGELYNMDLGGFQEQMKAIKKYTPGVSELIDYNIYDIIDGSDFSGRFIDYCCGELSDKLESLSSIILVDTFQISSLKEIKEFHSTFIEEGYEGSIIRHGNKPYGINKRCDSLLKYKDFQDIALPIYDIIPSEQRPNWGQFVFYWKGASYYKDGDNLMSTGMKFSHEEREEFLKNKEKYIGKTVEIRYFELSDYGVPRFPISVGFRNDKIIKN